MAFSDLVKQRYSVRKYDSRPIEAEKLAAILEAGRLAPTAVNYQPSGSWWSRARIWRR